MIADFLALVAAKGRWVLPIGLVVGVLVQPLAEILKPHVGAMVVFLLFLASLRIGPRAAIGALSDARIAAIAAILYQLVVPLLFIGLIYLTGWRSTAISALILVMAASPISGTPSLTIIMGYDPAPALRNLIFGTAILPATAFVVFWAAPGFGDIGTLITSSIRLLSLIALACAVAFAIRHYWLKELKVRHVSSIDGMSALVMAIVVIGLMSTVGTTLLQNPIFVLQMLGLAFLLCFGLQILAVLLFSRRKSGVSDTPGLGVSSGCRNSALFLAALPATLTEPLLLFIGCYQIPMYLTPILLSRFYDYFTENR